MFNTTLQITKLRSRFDWRKIASLEILQEIFDPVLFSPLWSHHQWTNLRWNEIVWSVRVKIIQGENITLYTIIFSVENQNYQYSWYHNSVRVEVHLRHNDTLLWFFTKWNKKFFLIIFIISNSIGFKWKIVKGMSGARFYKNQHYELS